MVSSVKKLVLAFAILALASGCGSQNQPVNAAPRNAMSLKGAGATFSAPLYKQWFATYATDHPQTAIDYDAVGSGEGVRRFIGANIKAGEQVDFEETGERPRI